MEIFMNIKDPAANRARTLAGLVAEVAFAILPLLVVTMVLLRAERSYKVFAAPEWSFGAAILFGQALTKLMVGLARGGDAAPGPVALTVALVVVFGLAPALFVLNAALEMHEAGKSVGVWMQASQVVLFSLGAIVYLLLGIVGESWRHSP
jgi:hypothetical protein